MYQNILIPTDGSEAAEAAAKHGQQLAETVGATVHVINCVEPIPLGKMPAGIKSSSSGHEGTIEQQRKLGEYAIGTIVDELEDAGISFVEELLHGPPGDEIIDYAEEHDIDLIVMGTEGRTGSERFLIGSVADKVVRRSPVPVMTIRG